MRAKVVTQHGESRSLFHVVNADAIDQFQPSIIATFATDRDGVMASGKAGLLARAINLSVAQEPWKRPDYFEVAKQLVKGA